MHGAPLVGALLLALVATMLISGVIGVLIEGTALRPLRGVPRTAAMITTIGVSYILFNIILQTVGADAQNFPNPMPDMRQVGCEAAMARSHATARHSAKILPESSKLQKFHSLNHGWTKSSVT